MFSTRALVLSLMVALAAASGGALAEQTADQLVVGSATQPSDVPAGLVLTGDSDMLKTDTEATTDPDDGELTFGGEQPPSDLTLTGERDMLTSPDAATDQAQEQFVGYRRRFFYPGFRRGYYGWRYPLPYWRRYGRRFYGGRCPFGRIYGGYYYC